MDLEQINQTLNIVFQLLMFVLPIAAALITWFLRTYVKSAEAEKTVGAIVRLSNAAIDFAEDLDKRGDLEKYLKLWNMPEDVINLSSDGLKKLNLAGKWLEAELNRQGIKMTDQDAQAWIAAEFQKRVGDIGRDRGIAARTGEAINLLRSLHQSGLIHLPADPVQITRLTDQVTNWVLAQLEEEGSDALRDQVYARFQTEMAAGTAAPAATSPENELATLAAQSVQYVQQLKASHELTLPEVDIAVAWVLTEVTKRGLGVTADQIARAVRAALGASGLG